MNRNETNQMNLDKFFSESCGNTIYSCFINSKKIHTKAREEFKNKLIGTDSSNTVLTWAIGTPENPMNKPCGPEENAEICKRFEETLRNGHYDFEKISGHYAGNDERSYFIPNIAVSDAQNLFKDYGQQSFIFGQKDYDEKTGQYYLEMEFWSRENANQNYELSDMEANVADKTGEVENFSKAHGFQFNIPFSIFQASQRFFERYNWKTPSQLNSEAFIYITNCDKYPGSQRWYYRGRMFHKPLYWEGADGIKNSYYRMWANN